jgi:dTMP kinase
MRGKFIVIEGPDGSGKTTIWEGLKNVLPADQYLFVRDPGSTPISTEIRKILLNPDFSEMCPTTELLLYTAARDQMLKQTIIPALEKGIHVISDRYIQSTLAYQCDGNATKGAFVSRELIVELAEQLGHPRVDLLINLSKDATVQLLRERLKQTDKNADRLECNDDNYFSAVLNSYQSLDTATSSCYCDAIVNVTVIDSRYNQTAIAECAISSVAATLNINNADYDPVVDRCDLIYDPVFVEDEDHIEEDTK